MRGDRKRKEKKRRPRRRIRCGLRGARKAHGHAP
jgi:hypothetical protein